MIPQRLNLGQRVLQYVSIVASAAAIANQMSEGELYAAALLFVPLVASVITLYMDRME